MCAMQAAEAASQMRGEDERQSQCPECGSASFLTIECGSMDECFCMQCDQDWSQPHLED